jgi:hypothetical protein
MAMNENVATKLELFSFNLGNRCCIFGKSLDQPQKFHAPVKSANWYILIFGEQPVVYEIEAQRYHQSDFGIELVPCLFCCGFPETYSLIGDVATGYLSRVSVDLFSLSCCGIFSAAFPSRRPPFSYMALPDGPLRTSGLSERHLLYGAMN